MKNLPTLPVVCCGPEVSPLERRASARVAAQFRALADPTRVLLVNRLAQCDEACVCDLTAASELSQPTVSHHLRILREAGLVEAERRGTWSWYRLVPEAVAALRDVLGGPAATGATRAA
jgi:ArsR family transcriptional regulator